MTTDFEVALQGRFEGVLRWPDLDTLWTAVHKSKDAFYIYEVGMDVPELPLAGKALKDEITAIDTILRVGHKEDYCGIVYVDNPKEPSLIKVFGPKNLGASCGSSGSKTWPRWIISHMPPSEVGTALDKDRKPKWWQNFTLKIK